AFLYRANVMARVSSRLARRTPVVVSTQHSLTPFTGRLPRIASRLTKRLVHQFVAVSGAVRDELIRAEGIGSTRISVIANGVDTHQYVTGPRDNRGANRGQQGHSVTIGSVGRLSREKGFNYLIESLAQLRADGVDARLIIAGDGPERGKLVALVTALGLDGN